VRIAVAFKVTPDYEALRAADWARVAGGAESAEARAEATRYVRRVLNVFDEAALELALRLRDARAERGLETELAAFTVAGREAEPFLTTLQALDFACARVDPGEGRADGGLDFAPSVTADLIAAGARRIGGDILLVGARGGPGDSGTVPFLVAEALGRPCLAAVTEIDPAEGEHLRVTLATGGDPVRGTITGPCVLAVGNAVVSMLRVPTLKDRLATRDRQIAVSSVADLGVDDVAARPMEQTVLTGLETIDRARPGVVVGGATAAEKARALYEGHLRARLERL
jgi:electron transfer flavoprotein beta subunit